jgi:hypothetical protein
VAGDGLPVLSGSARRVASKSRCLGCVAGLDVLGAELLATECEGGGGHGEACYVACGYHHHCSEFVVYSSCVLTSFSKRGV